VRKPPDVQPVARDGGVELQRLEVIAVARAGEEGRAVDRGAQLLPKVSPYALGVALEAVPLRRLRRERLGERRELLAHEPLEVVAPVLVGLRVQVEADDREARGLEGRQLVKVLVQRRVGSFFHINPPCRPSASYVTPKG
jgi:hypothetical protein